MWYNGGTERGSDRPTLASMPLENNLMPATESLMDILKFRKDWDLVTNSPLTFPIDGRKIIKAYDFQTWDSKPTEIGYVHHNIGDSREVLMSIINLYIPKSVHYKDNYIVFVAVA